jgi:hypothetical protein
MPPAVSAEPAALAQIERYPELKEFRKQIVETNCDNAELVNVPDPWDPREWRHLCLPARFEPAHPYPLLTDLRQKGTGKLWKDQRQPGEALWPAAFPLEELDKREATMTSYAVAGQLQQRPTSREGGLFKMAWFGNDQFLDSRHGATSPHPHTAAQ